jgi:hypothetical protein
MSGALLDLKTAWEELQAAVDGVRSVPFTVCLPGKV